MLWEQEAGGSKPSAPTIYPICFQGHPFSVSLWDGNVKKNQNRLVLLLQLEAAEKLTKKRVRHAPRHS